MTDLRSHQVAKLRQIASLLLPGDGDAPAAGDDADFDGRLVQALAAIGPERQALDRAVADVPEPVTWAVLTGLDEVDPAAFDIISSVCAAAYFMSPRALDAIGYYHGPRRAAHPEQIVDELETGVLQPIMDRPSMVRPIPAPGGGR